MRSRLYCALLAGLIVSACATGRGPPPPPPPPSGPVRTLDTTPPVVQPRPVQGAGRPAPAGASCRYCVSNDPTKRQYFDQRRRRYYYFDRARKSYYWENGDPKL